MDRRSLLPRRQHLRKPKVRRRGDRRCQTQPGSPCIDAGYVFGSIEIDEDVYGQSRSSHDDPGMPNIGYGQGGYLDIGAVEFRGTSCFADTNFDGLTPADFSAWVAAYNQGDFVADQNRDGVLTPSDFSAWVANYNTGCP